jgi:hypothetical protein
LQVSLKETIGHFLNSEIVMRPQPGRACGVKFQLAGFDGPMISFADELQVDDWSGRSWVPD